MEVSLRVAKTLCMVQEYELVQRSFDRSTHGVTPAQVKQGMTLARRLRDKYRGLAERQRREARGKQGPRGARPSQSNDRTVQKQQLFEQTMHRFERQLQNVEARDNGGDRTASARSAKPPRPQRSPERPPAKVATRRTAEQVLAEKRREAADAGAAGKAAANPGRTILNDPVAARRTRRETKSKASQLPRKRSHFADTARQHIVGHLAQQTRVEQARRDARND